MVSGFNPLRWDCTASGCFNIHRRPKIEVFADVFPRRINFGDVDGLVELNSMFCLLEWKGEGGAVRTGQRLSYLAFTRSRGNVVFIVEGDAETMLVRRHGCFWNGREEAMRHGGIEQLKDRMRRWVAWAEQHPPSPLPITDDRRTKVVA